MGGGRRGTAPGVPACRGWWRRMWPGGWGAGRGPARRVHPTTRTDGNALFMVNMVEHLVQQGWWCGGRGDGRCGKTLRPGGESARGVAAVAGAAH